MKGTHHDVIAELKSMLLRLFAGRAAHALSGSMQKPGDFRIDGGPHARCVGLCPIGANLSR